MNDFTPRDGEADPFKLAEQERWLDLARLGEDAWNTWAEDELKKPLEDRAVVDLSGQTIDVSDFLGFILPAVASFSEAKFSKDVDFGGATFSADADFSKVEFSETAYFGEATFAADAGFSGASFSKRADFNEASFSETAYFNKTLFAETVYFNETLFAETAYFNEASFLKRANFSQAIFSADADFSKVEFSETAYFGEATFAADADFSGAMFSKRADFSEASFSKCVDFDSVTMKSVWQMERARITESLSARSGDIQGHAYFTSIDFRVPPDFISTAFFQPPSFLGSTFGYPCLNRVVGKCSVSDGEARFRRLKQLAADTHDHELELSLFASEVRAKRFQSLDPRRIRDLPRFCLNYVYEWVSDFGQSWVRPLGWLILTVALAFATFASVTPAATSLWVAGVAAGVNIIPFAGQAVIGRQIMVTGLCPMPETDVGHLDCLTTLYTISAVEGFFGLIFLFLIGLGLRNRFRIR